MKLTARKITIGVVIVFAILLALPNFVGVNIQKHLPDSLHPISLGLDLKGGAYLLMEVDSNQVRRDRLDQLKSLVRQALIGQKGQDKIRFKSLRQDKEEIIFEVRESQQEDLIEKRLYGLGGETSYSETNGEYRVFYTKAGWDKIEKEVLSKSIEIVGRRIDSLGMKEPSIQQQGSNRISIQLPGVDTPEHIKDLIGKTAKMTFHMVAEDVKCSATKQVSYKGEMGQLEVCENIELSGEYLADSQVLYEEGRPAVSTTFIGIGAQQFETLTRENIGKRFAIVLDNEVLSAPVIQGAVPGGHGQITGHFTAQEAQELSLLLRSGALPAKLTVVEERTIGPGLGADSVKAGLTACIVGLILVMLTVVLVYGKWGWIINFILVLNMLMLVGVLSFMGATLTLPGIAGIILTLGMAVDANVLIFDRMREEAANGLSALRSLQAAYDRAFITILDSNITTLLAALFLFQFGSGPVRGFAVSLALGIFTSMFSGVYVSRTILEPLVYRTNKMPLFTKK